MFNDPRWYLEEAEESCSIEELPDSRKAILELAHLRAGA
jgi:hypothetical protein